MRRTFVRWLGAFGPSNYTLYECLVFEASREDEAVCEKITHNFGNIKAKVGVIIKESAIFRTFRCDCYSRYENGLLVTPYGNHRESSHNECWFHCKDAVEDIIVKTGLSTLRKETQNQVLKASRILNLPVYAVTKTGTFRREI